VSGARATLRVVDVQVSYPDRRRGADRGDRVVAVRGVDLRIDPGEALGLVGESGSGKSSLARALVGVVPMDRGQIHLGGEDLAALRSTDPQAAARRIQMVFQDVLGALDPRQRVGAALREVLSVHGLAGEDGGEMNAVELLRRVGLEPEHGGRFPHQLSGGQRQRVGIARALAVEPDVLVLDEPVSALDVSVQARILGLLDTLRRDLGIGVLMIAHDLAVVRNLCDRVAVMYRGGIMEVGPVSPLFDAPRHPYTIDLLAAVPRLGERPRGPRSYEPSGAGTKRLESRGGCPYFDRCAHPERDSECGAALPAAVEVEEGYRVACAKEH
jgi:oligopeptide/dipeptide ABC transporter ATP-binding protein